MKKRFVSLLLLLPLFGLTQLKYPVTKKGDVVDGYFGTFKVPDPYRWLEDDNSEETKAWVKEENKVTFDYLATLPDRAARSDLLQYRIQIGFADGFVRDDSTVRYFTRR